MTVRGRKKNHFTFGIRLFTLLFTVNSISGLRCQENLFAYKNDFSNPKLSFASTNGEKRKSWTRDGKYFMVSSDTSGKSWRQTEMIIYDPGIDYTLQTSLTLSTAGRYSAYGIAFGMQDSEHSNYFVFDPEGFFMVAVMDGDNIQMVKSWTKTALLNTMGKANQVEIKKSAGGISFRINGKEVAACASLKNFGTRTGFYVEGETSIEADYLQVLQAKKPINLVPDHDRFGKKESLGPLINSRYGEKHPVISPDGKFLYINREDHPQNVGGPKEDIWVSELKDGKWSELKNLGAPINNKDFNYIAGISSDNTVLLLGNVYSEDLQSMKEGFSISVKTKKGWGVPEPVTIGNYYNRNQYNGACISADKKVIIMTIERDDTYGEKDLYVSFRKEDNTWTEPMNMGAVVNSFAAEFGPYLAPDGKTLYFASFGHPGYGEADLFISKRLDDTWKNWSVPQNLGPKVNTSSWDGYFSVSAAGDYAYISSIEQGRTDLDAYRIRLPKSASTETLIFLKGKVYNAKTKSPLGSALKLLDAETGAVIQSLESSNETGEYSILISKPGSYHIAAFHKGFISIDKTVNIPEITGYKEFIHDLPLTPIEHGSTIILKNIFFAPNKFDLLPESNDELNKLAVMLEKNPSIRIQVAGHTSKTNEGEQFNLELSTSRALAVKNYLVKMGIDEKRIEHRGYGYTKPLYAESDEEHQAQNRRVEFSIISD